MHLSFIANATTWDPENTITVGAGLYDGTTEYERDRIIVHEVLHLFFHEGFHRDLAKKFLPGEPTNFGSEIDASDAINTFLDSDCTTYN